MAQLSNNPWLGVSPGAEAGVRDWRVQGRYDRGPMDLSVSQNAQQIAHARPDGRPHSVSPEHDYMHGRRGSGTWPDGTSKTSPLYNQGGRTFADGTPLTLDNLEAFKINPDAPPSAEAVAHGGILGKIGEFFKKIGVNQDYPEVERDLQGNEIITLPTGEKIIKELWESPGFQDNYFREKRNAR